MKRFDVGVNNQKVKNLHFFGPPSKSATGKPHTSFGWCSKVIPFSIGCDRVRHAHAAWFITARRVCIARTMPSQDVRHTPVFCLNGYTHAQSYFSPAGSPTIIFIFFTPNGVTILWREPPPPNAGVECKEGIKIAIFDEYFAFSRKWCKIEQLLWKANRKPHPSFLMVPVWMTFSDL